MVNPDGANPPGITATLTSGKATIDLSDEALAGLPAFEGFQIGAGSENARFTFRLAEMTFAQPLPDFVGFGCRIDLRVTTVGAAFKFVLPASSSGKFCPDNNGGKVKLIALRAVALQPDVHGLPPARSRPGPPAMPTGSSCSTCRPMPRSTTPTNT